MCIRDRFITHECPFKMNKPYSCKGPANRPGDHVFPRLFEGSASKRTCFYAIPRPPKLAHTMCFYAIYGHPTSILPPWVQIWPKCVPGCPFQAFWRHGPRYSQNASQELDFRHAAAMGPDMAKMCPRRPISSILAPWVQMWPKCVPEGPFQAFWRHGPASESTFFHAK